MDKIGGKTLQEIQDLPLSEMHNHLREYVDPKWGKPKGVEGPYRVFEIAAHLTTWERFKVKANSYDQAVEKAEQYIGDTFSCDEHELFNVFDKELGVYNE